MWAQRLNQLTETQRQDIWLRADEGSSLTQLSKRYGVSLATISRVVSDRRQRRNVTAVPDEPEAKIIVSAKDTEVLGDEFEKLEGFGDLHSNTAHKKKRTGK